MAERVMRDAGGAVTVTFGFGEGVFAPGRFGLERARPGGLRPLPAFAGDALDPALSDGDLLVQVCATERGAADAVVEELRRVAAALARVRWDVRGWLNVDPQRPAGTPRDALGFRDGTMNLKRPRDFDRHVWVSGRERSWMVGGTFLVVRRIAVDAQAFGRLPLGEQERVIGRHRDSGAPLGGTREFDPIPLHDDADGRPIVPLDAHARLAAPRTNVPGAVLLRRSYVYDGGLLFMSFQRDPRRQFVPVQRQLAEHDALNHYVTHVGSGVFAIPPGARPGGFVGDGLLDAR